MHPIFISGNLPFTRETLAMITRHSLLAISNMQVSCDLAGEAAILNLADGVYYGLDQVGAFVWSLLSVPHTLDELCAAVTAEYDVDRQRCESDLMALLEELHAKGLITVGGERDS
jgi:hypothetical protein